MTLSDMSLPNIHELWQLIDQGGPIVLVLVLLSVAALTVSLLKAAQFIILGVGKERRSVKAALRHWRAGNREAALRQLQGEQSAVAMLAQTAMNSDIDPRPIALLREEIESRAIDHLASLRSYLRVLEAASQLAPLIGLFGTVLGMMAAFKALQSTGTEADPAALAGGIWTALITTAVGLAIAIPASFVLYWFEGRIAREQTIIETTVTSVLTAPAPASPPTQPDHSPALGISNAA